MRTPCSTVSGRPPCWPSRCVVSVVQTAGGIAAGRSLQSRRGIRHEGNALEQLGLDRIWHVLKIHTTDVSNVVNVDCYCQSMSS